MVATPVLAGAILRPRDGRAGGSPQTQTRRGHRPDHRHRRPALGLAVGISQLSAGAVAGRGCWAWPAPSFAVALPLASRWYPPEHQGTALGIAGAGNSGTVLAALFAPSLAAAFGWSNVFGLALIPLCAGAYASICSWPRTRPIARRAKSLADYLKVLRDRDAWWFMFFYCVTFGGFVGLASSLTIYFNDQYGMSPVIAGYFTAACVFAGSLVRPLGGALADRIGGMRTLADVYVVAALFLAIASFGMPTAVAGADGVRRRDVHAGHGQRRGVPTGAATFPQGDRRDDRPGRHGRRRGRLLPGRPAWATSSSAPATIRSGCMIFAGLALLALVGLYGVKTRWRTTWGAAHIAGARLIGASDKAPMVWRTNQAPWGLQSPDNSSSITMPLKVSLGQATRLGGRATQRRLRRLCPAGRRAAEPRAASWRCWPMAWAALSHGREAAEYAARGLLADYYATPETWSIPYSLDRVIQPINQWLVAQAARRRVEGMACALSALVLCGARAFIAHVGDTRIYRLRHGELTRLTQDHAWDAPELRHVLKRAVGLDAQLSVDYSDEALQGGRRVHAGQRRRVGSLAAGRTASPAESLSGPQARCRSLGRCGAARRRPGQRHLSGGARAGSAAARSAGMGARGAQPAAAARPQARASTR